MKTKSLFLKIGLVIFIVIAYYFLSRTPVNREIKNPAQEEQTLPEGWFKTDEDSQGVLLRFEKGSNTQIRPTVVLIESLTEEKNATDYTDRLINGAKKTLTSLKFERDEIGEEDGYFVRDLSGFYINGGKKIGIRQKLYIKDGKVHTLTASFEYEIKDENLKVEIENIFALLATSKILIQ